MAAGCESTVRLQVTIKVTDPETPTTQNSTQSFCLTDSPTFASIQANESNVSWYNTSNGGTEIPLATALTTGVYYGAIRDLAAGCESTVRLQVTIMVTDPDTPTTQNSTQSFCLTDSPTFASIQTNESNVSWYNTSNGGTEIPLATALTTGVYYGAIRDLAAGCESTVRLQVTITVTDPDTPTTQNTNQSFCSNTTITVSNIQINENNVVWYATPTGGPIISPTVAITSGIYYASIKDATTGCEGAVRLRVTVTILPPGIPTTDHDAQTFCISENPTVTNIQVNETNVVWYSSMTSATPISTTAIIGTGDYFATIKNPTSDCESSSRLKVAVTVADPDIPTTNSENQNFCAQANPTVADIRVNDSNVIWYNVASGGIALEPTTALVAGDYFGASKDPESGCESTIRLKVSIKLGNSSNPTTDNSTQTFCSTSSPTVSDIQVNESDVAWYSSASSQTPYPPTTPLVAGVYYGAISNQVAGCQSIVRLQVNIILREGSSPPTTTNPTQTFCSSDFPKVSNIQVNEENVVWFNAAAGGTQFVSTAVLVTGDYYGEFSSSEGGCENQTRLKVSIIVNSPGIPTTTKPTQTFCDTASPKVSDIQVNETNVIWFNVETGGTPLDATTLLTAAVYYGELRDKPAVVCDGPSRLAVTINFDLDSQVAINTTEATPCVFEGVTYSISNGMSNYVWTITNGTIALGGGINDNTVTVTWPKLGPGKVELEYINTCGVTTSKSLDVIVETCSDLTITNVVDNPTPKHGDIIMFTVEIKNVGEGNFIDLEIRNLLPSGFRLTGAFVTTGIYETNDGLWTVPVLNASESITLQLTAQVLNLNEETDKPNKTNKIAAAEPYVSIASIEVSSPLDVDAANNTATVEVFPVVEEENICLTVYNEFTPNNDGANDLFKIECIEIFPNNELKVFNRYGALVYNKKHYENDWNGTANVSGVINRGDMLPTGTYFYVLDSGDGTVKKGWLSVMR